MQYEYFINLDERGDFYADVRNPAGETVLEIKSDEDGCIDMVTDGFMRHTEDVDGLAEYLIDTGIINDDDTVIKAN